MNKLVLCLGIFAAVLCSFTLAPAWEFELTGNLSWTYQGMSQTGHKGFFGPYNVDNGAGTRDANLNFWDGGRFDTSMVTGADAGWSYYNVELFPVLKINPAIRFNAKYRMGTYGDPLASDYHTFDAPGINNAFSEGQWTMFWVTAQTPWGIVSLGKRPWVFGTGLQYDGQDSTSTESLLIAAPFGPLDIGLAFYPYRFAGTSSIYSYSPLDLYNNSSFEMRIDAPNVTYYGSHRLPRQYFSRADKNGTFKRDLLGFITYFNGPMNAGVTASYGDFHIGPEAVLRNVDPPNTYTLHPVGPRTALDSGLCHGSAFVKYFNGRVFFNAEAAWLYWTDIFRGQDQAAVDPPLNRYIQQWKYMTEFGAVMGPTKLSFLAFWAPGPDRRAGVMIDRQPAAFVRHSTFDQFLGGHDVVRPYGYLFAYNYGAGLNAYNFSVNGYVRDALVLATRLDYAAASNLNLYTTFMYANRTSNGYSWGCIEPAAGLYPNVFPLSPDLDYNLNRYPDSPNIPDSALGYEVTLGADWKLLEGWNLGMVAAYWQPGKWFNYACIDRSVPAWHIGTAANNFGVRPNREISPIIGYQVNSSFYF